jgi:hypothetical protein
MFSSKAGGAYPCGARYGTYFKCSLIALDENVSLGWNWPTVTNTLAYYERELITTVKWFIVQTLLDEKRVLDNDFEKVIKIDLPSN